MNSNPTVIGSFERSGSVERSPFVWQVGGDGLFEYAYEPISLTGINDAGQMIGRYDTPMQPESAFVTSSDGTRTRINLGDLGGYGSHASAINNAGRIAGDSPAGPDRISHVFLWVNGAMTDLGTLDGASSHAADINMADEIVGFAETPSGTRAFRYGDSTFTDLGSFGGAFSTAAAINDAGRIVGGSTLAGEEPQAQRAFLYVNYRMYDLNDCIEPLPDTLAFAGKINNRGQILAHGQCDPGDCRAYLLTPVTPP
jgi:probable HAF family extracellular repeat protein